MAKVEEIEKEYRENIERAMEQLSYEMPDYISVYGEAAYNVAIDAMEKQIPMKPYIRSANTIEGNTVEVCGNCEEFVFGEWRFKYCPICGQRIDRSEAE